MYNKKAVIISITPTNNIFPSNNDEIKSSKKKPAKTAGTIEISTFNVKSKLSPVLKQNKSDRINWMSFLKTKIVLKAVAEWRVTVISKLCSPP